ncbi:MAG: peptidylprolyl isomerase [Myxococcota bacterium]
MGPMVWLAVIGCSGSPSGAAPSASAPGGMPAGAEASGKHVATVGDGFVTDADFAASASRVQQPGQELTAEQRAEVLDKLVVEEILFQEAAAKGLYRDPKVRKIMVNLLLREEVYDDVRSSDISQEELQAYYDAHQSEFTVPEKLQIKRIFLRYGGDSTRSQADAMALAKDLQARIKKDPTSFSSLAEQNSDDPYKRRGGDLGYVARDGKPGVPDAVIEKAFSMPVGQISDPFDAGEGINLVLVAAKRQAVERTFDQMKGSVLRRLKNDKFEELTDAYIAKVRGKYSVDVDDAALAGVKVESRPLAPSGVDPTTLLPGVGPRPDRDAPPGMGDEDPGLVQPGLEVEQE